MKSDIKPESEQPEKLLTIHLTVAEADAVACAINNFLREHKGDNSDWMTSMRNRLNEALDKLG